MTRSEQMVAIIVSDYCKRGGCTPDEVLDIYNGMGIQDDEAMALLLVCSLYTNSILRKEPLINSKK